MGARTKAGHELPMDGFRRLYESLAQAATHAQHLKEHCSDVQQAVCRNIASAVSVRCRHLRQRGSRAAVALASVNPPQVEEKRAPSESVTASQGDASAPASTSKPGKVSGSIWGPRGARSAANGAADAATQQDAPEPSLFIADIVFSGAEGDELAVARTSNPLPRNSHATEADILAARNSLASTGLFSAISMSVYRDSNGDGHILEFKLKPNAEFKGHEVKGSRVLPPGLIDNIFAGAKGKTSDMNLYELAARRIDEWYADNGVFGGVKEDIDMRKKSLTTGEYVFEVEELEVGDVRLRFVDKKGNEMQGRTKTDLLQRYIRTASGEVLHTDGLQKDIRELTDLDVFDDVRILPMVRPAGAQAGQDSSVATPESRHPIADLEYQITEKRKFGSFSCQGGATLEGGLSDLEPIGTLTYTNNNVMGLLQRVRMMFMMRKWTDKSVELLWVNPWIQGPNRRIAQTASAGINRVNQDSIFGPALDEVRDNASDSKAHTSVIVERSTVSFDRSTSLSDTVYGTLGVGINRNRCVSESGTTLLEDAYRWPLAHSESGVDKAFKLYSSLVMRRDHLAMRVSTEKSVVPPGSKAWLDYLRADGQAMVEQPTPMGLLRACLSGGLQKGDLPAYDAHPLGGVNCVRGYSEGDLGTARHWGVVNLEAERPLPFIANMMGVVFADAGTDFTSGVTVVGDPAGSRGKQGTGVGYGMGVRLGSPMGLIRFEYGWTGGSKWSSDGHWSIPGGRLHVGIGSRF
eukprot:jgi/Ulvmu1/4830/UM020_0116.1